MQSMQIKEVLFGLNFYLYKESGQTHLNPNTGRTLHDGVYLFPTDWNLCLSTRKPEPRQSY